MVVNTSAIDCLKRLVSEMTYYVSSGTLNPTHSLTQSRPIHTKRVYVRLRPSTRVYVRRRA